MKILPQWVCYRIEASENGSKPKKTIISPNTGKFAACNNPDTWTDFETAKAYCQKYNFEGLAFALTSGIVFVDTDNAIEKGTHNITSDEAASMLSALPNTFTERSVSGTGIHILLKGLLPENAVKRNDSKGLEMYDTKRFICMTGDTLTGSIALADYSAQIADINRKFMGERKQLSRTSRLTVSDQSDAALITRIAKSKQGTKFNRLYSGDTSGYPSPSNADFAFANILAWWTKDIGQIERIFRSSGLMREKFDRRTGESTYGQNLIAAALDKQTGKSPQNFEM